MHISEGVLNAPVLISGALLSIGGIATGLKKIDPPKIPQAAILTSAFFIASLIHVPLGPSSVHLILNGLLGIFLGWASFPAIAIALLLQAIFFQFGGLIVLGVNTFTMACPAVAFYYLSQPLIIRKKYILAGAITGSGSVLGAGLLVALALALTGEGFLPAAQTILLAHIPIMIIEGIITATIISFMAKVKPELLNPNPTTDNLT